MAIFWKVGGWCQDLLDNFGTIFSILGQLRDIFFHFGAIWGSFGCHFMFDFSLQTLTVMQIQIYEKILKNLWFLQCFLCIKSYCYVIWFVLISVYFGSSARKPGVLASKRLAKPSFERFGLMLGHGWDDFPSFWDDLGVLWSFKNICYGRRKRFETFDFA